MALNKVTLVVDVGSGQGYYRGSGTGYFTPSAVLTDAADHLVVDQEPVPVTFGSAAGAPRVQLLATDNAALLPAGWAWTFTPPAGSGMTAFSFFLPFASGSVQYLSAQAPVSSVVTMQAYMPLPSGTPTAGQVPVATGSGEGSAWGNAGGGFSNPMTTLGDLIYENATPAAARLAADTSNTRKFLRTQASGGVGQAPAWDTIQAADVPTLNQNTTGTAAGLSATLAIGSGGTGSTTRNFAGLLTPTAVKTTTYSAAAGDYVPCDTTSGSFTVTLPSAPADLTVVGVKMVIQGSTNTVTVACAGSDVFNKAGGGTTGTLTLVNQGMLLQYKASGGIWYIVADDLSLSQLDGRYVLVTAEGAANGVATLDSGGHVPAAQLPAATTSTQGAVILDGTAADIKALASSAAAGSSTKAPAADHVHPNTGLVTGVTATDTSIVVGGTSQAPTIATGTLDVIATQHAPAANWSNNSHKITSLANGSASSDAAAFGQIPVADFSGTAGPTAAGLGLALMGVSPYWATGSGNASNGILIIILCTAVRSATVTTLGALIQTAGVTAGAGVNQLALFSEGGTLLAQTGDMTTAFGSIGYAEGVIANPGGISSYALVQGTNYYLAILASFTGTAPKTAIVGSQIPSAALNGHYLCRSLSAQATMPASITPSSMTNLVNLPVLYAR